MTGLLDDLSNAIKACGCPVMVHISTHGAGKTIDIRGKTWLRGATGPATATWQDLADGLPSNVNGLFLSACDADAFVGKTTAEQRGYGYLVALKGRTYESAARACQRSFYSLLATHGPDSLGDRIRAWARLLNAACEVSVWDAKLGGLTPTNGPSHLSEVLCKKKGKKVSWCVGSARFESAALLVYDPPVGSRVISSCIDVTTAGTSWPWSETERTVRLFGPTLPGPGSQTSVHVFSSKTLALCILVFAIGVVLTAVDLAHWQTSPTVAKLSGTSAPVVSAAVAAVLGLLVAGEELRRRAKARPLLVFLTVGLLLTALCLSDFFLFGKRVTNNAGVAIKVGGQLLEPDASVTVPRDWTPGEHVSLSSTRELRCASEEWRLSKVDSEVKDRPLISDGGNCAPNLDEVQLVSFRKFLPGETNDAGAGPTYLVTLKPVPGERDAGYVQEESLRAYFGSWSPIEITAPSMPGMEVRPGAASASGYEWKIELAAGNSRLFVPPDRNATLFAKDGGGAAFVDRIPAACDRARLLSLPPWSPQQDRLVSLSRYAVVDGRFVVSDRVSVPAAGKSLLVCEYPTRIGIELILGRRTSKPTVLATFQRQMIPLDSIDVLGAGRLACPIGDRVTLGTVNEVCHHKNRLSLTAIQGGEGRYLACWISDSEGAVAAAEQAACPAAPMVLCGCDSGQVDGCGPNDHVVQHVLSDGCTPKAGCTHVCRGSRP